MPAPKPKPVKLSYKEQRELDEMQEHLHAAEAQVESLQQEIAALAGGDYKLLNAKSGELHDAMEMVDRLYHRWEELEAKVRR